jgi:hypothetical protein
LTIARATPSSSRSGRLAGEDRLVDGVQHAQPLRVPGQRALRRLVRRHQPRIQPRVLDQQHGQDEADGGQAVDAPGVEADIEAAVVEHRGEADIEEPRAHHHHQPQVEHGMRPPQPERAQRDEAQAPHARDDEDQRGRVAIARHDRRQRGVPGRGEERERKDHRERRGGREANRRARAPAERRLVLQDYIGDDGEREAAVPEHVQPGGGLRTGAEQAARREQPREAEGMADRHPGAEQVSAAEREQRPRAQDADLREQQRRRQQIGAHQRRLIDRNEGGNRGELHLRERHGEQEERRGGGHDAERDPSLGEVRRQARQEQAPRGRATGRARIRGCAAARRRTVLTARSHR